MLYLIAHGPLDALLAGNSFRSIETNITFVAQTALVPFVTYGRRDHSIVSTSLLDSKRRGSLLPFGPISPFGPWFPMNPRGPPGPTRPCTPLDGNLTVSRTRDSNRISLTRILCRLHHPMADRWQENDSFFRGAKECAYNFSFTSIVALGTTTDRKKKNIRDRHAFRTDRLPVTPLIPRRPTYPSFPVGPIGP